MKLEGVDQSEVNQLMSIEDYKVHLSEDGV